MTPIEKHRAKFWAEVSDHPLLTFVVSLATGDKKRLQAEDVDIRDGCLVGLVNDPKHISDEGFLSQRTAWSLPAGSWTYVERDWETELAAGEDGEAVD